MNSTQKKLEYNLIKEKILSYLFSQKGKDLITNMNPATDFNIVNEELAKTNNLLKLIVKYGSLPFLEDFDNNLLENDNILERVYYIEELLFLKLYLQMEKDFDNHYSLFKIEDLKNNIKEMFDFNDHHRLLTEFNQIFTINGEIFDDATKELKVIRTKIKKLYFDLDTKMQRLLKTYEPYLSESIIVTRNNRFCLAIKDSYKNKVKGVIHDISQSKQTIFIEPEVSLQIMADIELNKILESKEINKILINLTTLVNNNIETLKENYNKLVVLDVIHAKAKYSLSINGVKPKLNHEGIITLINAKHPLLDPKIAVPISLELNKNNNILLITGPNTGGKTVALKTIGLLSLMIHSGILIPVNEDSNLAVFDNIFADLGDEQSIANSLSTFSSHIANIIYFINNLTDNSLILLDELGSGTDPNEGVALAIAIIEEFNKKDIRLVVTSHYSELKTYAYESDGILTASVAFDKDSLQPLYYLQHGISGDSHARLIAKRLGMPNSVIDKSDILYANRETDLTKILSKLSIEKENLEKERNQLRLEKNNYQKEKLELEKTKERLLGEQTSLLDKIRKTEEEKWLKKEKDINELISVIELEQNVKQHQVTSLKGLVNEKVKKEVIYDKEQVLKVNDQVYIKSYQQYGYITEIVKDKYRVVFGIFDLWFKNSDLTKVEEKPVVKKEVTRKKKSTTSNVITKEANMTLDLRGFRYEEVHEAIDQAVDNALLSNLNTLTIIHGFGTGAVRDAVYQYIRTSKHISSSRYGGEGEGLNGVTVITIK